MRKRLLAAGTLLLALLAGAWGNVLAASLCPHMAQDHACCHAHAAHDPATHGAMDGMQMGDMPAGPEVEQSPDARALGQSAGADGRCVCHSQPEATPAALREAEQPRRGGNVVAPLSPSAPVSTAASFVPNVSAREHAPPGATRSALHVLIGVFRI